MYIERWSRADIKCALLNLPLSVVACWPAVRALAPVACWPQGRPLGRAQELKSSGLPDAGGRWGTVHLAVFKGLATLGQRVGGGRQLGEKGLRGSAAPAPYHVFRGFCCAVDDPAVKPKGVYIYIYICMYIYT